jgi:hypothetical protein
MANKKQEPPDFERELKAARETGRLMVMDELTKTKEQLTAAEFLFTSIGQLQALGYTRAQAKFFMTVKLKAMKESREYYEKYGLRWPVFCEKIGVPDRTADRWIAEIADIRQDFLATLANLSGVTFNKIKYLGMGSSATLADSDTSLVEFKDAELYFDGEKVPMEKEAINAVLDRLELTYKERLAEHKKGDANVRAILTEDIKGLKTEKKALIAEVDKLTPYKPQDPDKKAIGIFGHVDNHLEEIDKLLRHFAVIDASELDGGTISKVQSIYKRITDRLELWEDNWATHLAGEGD